MTMQISINESDWKLFRQKLPVWQEAYIDSLNREYASLLAGTGTASDKFWKLEKRINSDKHRILLTVGGRRKILIPRLAHNTPPDDSVRRRRRGGR